MIKDITRREFIATATIATGFALAVQPVSAKAITTDNKGLVAGAVKIPVKDGEIPAYRAQPDTGENFLIVLVIQEIFGVHEHIQDVARRFAKLGY
jgi:carboxymethylenebutenolidase